MNELHFAASTGMKALAIAAFAAIAFVSVLIWRRSGGGRRVLAVESLRIIGAALAAITLLQPELRTTQSPDRKPVVAVLWDDSLSMTTRDVTGKPDDKGAPVLTRGEWIKAQLDGKFWEPLEGPNTVVVEPFSTPPTPEKAAENGTDINGALVNLLKRQDNLRAVVLLTDGDWNTGDSPLEAAAEYWPKKIPVFPIAVGAPKALPDLALTDVSAPSFGIVGDKVQIGFTIRNSLPEAIATTVRIDDGTGRMVSKQVKLPPQRETTENVFWTPNREGSSTLTIDVEGVPGEMLADNNERKIQLNARRESIKVLVLDSLPRWEYRFIRNALQRDPGVTVRTMLFHPDAEVRGGGPDYADKFPADLKELSTFDVVFIGDVGVGPGQLTIEQAGLIRELVEQQASGLVFIPGRMGHQNTLVGTPLGDLMPVVLDESRKQGTAAPAPSALVLTESGNRNLLTILTPDERDNPKLWKSLPGFYWSAPVLKARAGTDVLGVHETMKNDFGRIPLLVTMTAGTGKVLYLGTDSAWRWRKGVEDLYHYRFWGQVARWMSYQRKMAEGEKLRLFYAPENPVAGVTLTLNANAYDTYGVPLKDGTVLLDATTPDGRTRRLELTPNRDGPGSFHGTFPVTQPGEHVFTASCPENGDSVTTKFYVQGEPIERTGQPANPAILADIARITRGGLADPGELPALIEKIGALPDPEPSISILRLWSHWAWAAVILVIFTAFWIGRKAIGTI